MDKVRVGSVYIFHPNFMDKGDRGGKLFRDGQRVRVINLPGCPPANTMGQCYIVDVKAVKDARGRYHEAFAMVCTSSLTED